MNANADDKTKKINNRLTSLGIGYICSQREELKKKIN